MLERHRVEIANTQIIEVIVVADSPQEASERALQNESEPGDSWHEEPKVARILKLEG